MPKKNFFLLLLVSSTLSLGMSLVAIISSAETNAEFVNQVDFAIRDTDPEQAAQRLKKAAAFIADHELQNSDICVFAYSPDCDTSELYRKLNDSVEDLTIAHRYDLLTKTSTLREVKESFVRSGILGEELIYPRSLFRTVAWGDSPAVGWLLDNLWKTSTLTAIATGLWLILPPKKAVRRKKTKV